MSRKRKPPAPSSISALRSASTAVFRARETVARMAGSIEGGNPEAFIAAMTAARLAAAFMNSSTLTIHQSSWTQLRKEEPIQVVPQRQWSSAARRRLRPRGREGAQPRSGSVVTGRRKFGPNEQYDASTTTWRSLRSDLRISSCPRRSTLANSRSNSHPSASCPLRSNSVRIPSYYLGWPEAIAASRKQC
ncbi:hypothetical protein DFJ73DRAFT_864301 [Zopfochytrium polystomum]|nr:hypothetical protein DFJ73DRAFT_864301 [Zopfochytrium polystomum]